MSTAVDSVVETTSQRSARATRELCGVLGLGTLRGKDLTLLTIALAEQATQEAKINSGLADRVREAFNELKATSQTSARGKPKDAFEALVPVGPVDFTRLSPHGPMDPYALYEAYGHKQALRVLSDLTLENLKSSAAIVEQRNPGTRPTNRRTKAALIQYIIEYVANEIG